MAAPLRARVRPDGRRFYGCSSYHERGRTICTNNADVPMRIADSELVSALLEDVLDEGMVRDAVNAAVAELQGDGADRLPAIELELAKLEHERARLVTAIAAGGELESLVSALRARETRRKELQAARTAAATRRRLRMSDTTQIRHELRALAASWREVLVDHPLHARPIIAGLLVARVTIVPTAKGSWRLMDEGTLAGLF